MPQNYKITLKFFFQIQLGVKQLPHKIFKQQRFSAASVAMFKCPSVLIWCF